MCSMCFSPVVPGRLDDPDHGLTRAWWVHLFACATDQTRSQGLGSPMEPCFKVCSPNSISTERFRLVSTLCPHQWEWLMGSPINLTTFLARARDRFGQRYDYSDIVYKSYKTPIKIRCTLHPVRVISITPERHLQTTGGCRYCLRAWRNQQLERTLRIPSPPTPDPLRFYQHVRSPSTSVLNMAPLV